jgi:hypothetical protein
MKCTICKQPVILHPTAEQRAKKFGGKAEDYTRLFLTHNTCELKKRAQETTDLMRRIVAQQARNRVTLK